MLEYVLKMQEISDCHLLFISKEEEGFIPRVQKELKDKTLLVTRQ